MGHIINVYWDLGAMYPLKNNSVAKEQEIIFSEFIIKPICAVFDRLKNFCRQSLTMPGQNTMEM